jgi:hypothetical protein
VYGGGIYAVVSTIVSCTITTNLTIAGAGGGAYLDQCEMDRCVIVGNRNSGFTYPPGRGGGVFNTNSIIRNSLIAGNRAASSEDSPSLGGGVYLRGGSLIDCTVTGNQAAEAGGIYVESGNVRNSIVYFNSAPTNADWYNGGGSFAYSCTTPDPGTVGNIVQDPQFVDRTNGNYRLAPTSPCIDAGVNEQWMVGATDPDGNPRIVNGTVDLGAWESTNTLHTVISHPLVQLAPAQVNNGFIRSMIGGLPRQGTIIAERSTDLSQWQPIQTNTIAGDTFDLAIPCSPGSPHQFFRVLIKY